MNEDGGNQSSRDSTGRWSGVPLLAALAVLCLAVLSVVWTDESGSRGEGTLLVLDPLRDVRGDQVYQSLARVCSDVTGCALSVTVSTNPATFLALASDAFLVVCPDGVALRLDARIFDPVVTGRKRAPQNLRPNSVLLYRKEAGRELRPWLTRPTRTVLGDSLSLACLAPLCDGDGPVRIPATVTCGVDPYDHACVARSVPLGGFDYYVLRQWEVESLIAAGILDTAAWGVEKLTGPLPGLVLMANTGWLSAPDLLTLREVLIGLGQTKEPLSPSNRECANALGALGLDGFHLLLEPDFDRLRRRYGGCWPQEAE